MWGGVKVPYSYELTMPIVTDENTKTRYGRWTLLYHGKKVGYNQFYWCRCACGKEKEVAISSLRSGHSTSCGCYRREVNSEAKIHDITGQRFNYFVAVERVGIGSRGAIWKCQCDCGVIKEVNYADIARGHVSSCGCMTNKLKSEKAKTHGLSKTPTYQIWLGIIKRCEDEGCANYHLYGGRGIQMCRRWREDYLAFLEDMGERPSDNLSIDRIDNNGNYAPGNCRWATDTEQVNNTRRNNRLTLNGVTQNLGQWAKQTGLPRDAIFMRIKRGWSVEKALTTPLRKSRNKSTDDTESRSSAVD